MNSDIRKDIDIVIIGGIGIDTNVYLLNQDIDFNVEANFTENKDYIGGAGGYTLRGFRNLGFKTAIIGTIGNDFLGEFIKKTLENENIDISCLFIDKEGTKRSINFMYKDGRRKNFYDGKGHMIYDIDLNKCKMILKSSKIAHFNLMNWSRKLLPIAKNLGLIISCDLQDMISINDPYRQDFIKYADILFFSNVNFDNPTQVIEKLLFKNDNVIIIVGMGKKGCTIGTKEKISFYNSIDLEKFPIIDTNGAGDGLVTGFISSYYFDNFNLNNSVLRAQICARYTCSLKGQTDNLITKEQLNKFYKIKKNNKKLKENE